MSGYGLILSCVLGGILFLSLILLVFSIIFSRVHYQYAFEGHRIDVFVKITTCQLCFDGKVIDEMKPFFKFAVSLSAKVGDIEIKTRIGKGWVTPKVRTIINNQLIENGKRYFK